MQDAKISVPPAPGLRRSCRSLRRDRAGAVPARLRRSWADAAVRQLREHQGIRGSSSAALSARSCPKAEPEEGAIPGCHLRHEAAGQAGNNSRISSAPLGVPAAARAQLTPCAITNANNSAAHLYSTLCPRFSADFIRRIDFSFTTPLI